MSLMLTTVCVILFVFRGVVNMEIKENDRAFLSCDAEHPGSVFWFRLKENGQGFEYIAMYSKSRRTGQAADPHKFKVHEKSLELEQFKQGKDSGTYGCVSINNNELRFASTIKLRGQTVPTTIKPKVQTTPLQTVASTTAVVSCTQTTKGKASGSIDVLLGCEQQILIPLLTGCGCLLLLLLITIIYCNRIRTRRCPHHYKRQARSRPAGHKTLPNPPDY